MTAFTGAHSLLSRRRILLVEERKRFCTVLALLDRQHAALTGDISALSDYSALAEQTLTGIVEVARCAEALRNGADDEACLAALCDEITVLRGRAESKLVENKTLLAARMAACEESLKKIHTKTTRRGRSLFAPGPAGVLCDMRG